MIKAIRKWLNTWEWKSTAEFRELWRINDGHRRRIAELEDQVGRAKAQLSWEVKARHTPDKRPTRVGAFMITTGYQGKPLSDNFNDEAVARIRKLMKETVDANGHPKTKKSRKKTK